MSIYAFELLQTSTDGSEDDAFVHKGSTRHAEDRAFERNWCVFRDGKHLALWISSLDTRLLSLLCRYAQQCFLSGSQQMKRHFKPGGVGRPLATPSSVVSDARICCALSIYARDSSLQLFMLRDAHENNVGLLMRSGAPLWSAAQ